MKSINFYYSLLLFLTIFIYIPLNNTLINLKLSSYPTLTILAIVVLLGILINLTNLNIFFKFLLNYTPFSLIFTIITFIYILFSSYLTDYSYFVPKSYLNETNLFYIIYLFSGFLLAYYYKYLSFFFQKSKYTIIISSSLGILIFLILISNNSLINIINRSIFKEVSISYQLVADLLCILSFITIAKYYKSKITVLNFIITIIILFILSSRSSILFYVLTILLFLIYTKNIKTIVLSFILILLFSNFFYNDIVSFYKKDDRITKLLTFDTKDEVSINQRNILLEKNLIDIKENWFTGNLYGEFHTFKKSGTYIHNYLSYLQNFGFLPFLLFNILLLRISYFILIKRDATFDNRFIFLIFIFTLLSVLFTRSYAAMYFLPLIILSESYANIKRKETIY